MNYFHDIFLSEGDAVAVVRSVCLVITAFAFAFKALLGEFLIISNSKVNEMNRTTLALFALPHRFSQYGSVNLHLFHD